MKICVIRHGETDWNVQKRFQGREDIPLNQTGIQQAEKAAKNLQHESWDMIISSPLQRAFKTACIIGERLKIKEILQDRTFIERDFGEASGMTWDDQENKFPDRNIPGRESDHLLQTRIVAGMEAIRERCGSKKIILVTHGAVIHILLKSLSQGRIDLGEMVIPNGCIYEFTYTAQGWQIEMKDTA